MNNVGIGDWTITLFNDLEHEQFRAGLQQPCRSLQGTRKRIARRQLPVVGSVAHPTPKIEKAEPFFMHPPAVLCSILDTTNTNITAWWQLLDLAVQSSEWRGGRTGPCG